MKYPLIFTLMFVSTSAYCQHSGKYDSLIPVINEIIKDTKTPGLSIAIIENYQLAWAKGFGLQEEGAQDSVTTDTQFQAASITKSLTAVTIMKMAQEGKISLNNDVNDQLVSWKIPANNFTATSPVTVKQLLNHTAGIATDGFPRYTATDSLPDLVKALKGEPPATNKPVTVTNYPGKKYAYTGGGYVILEALLTDIEKKAFAAILQEEIFGPLQMHRSTLGHPSDQQFASGHLKKNEVIGGKYFTTYPLSFGSLWSTPSDLAKFLAAVQLSLKEEGAAHILGRENTRLMLTPVSFSGHTAGGQYALGFTLEKRGPKPFFGHDGHNYGFIASMLGSLEGGYGMVIMTNSENGWKAINKIKKLVGRKYWGLGPYREKK